MTDTPWPRAVRPSATCCMSRPVVLTSGGYCRISSRMFTGLFANQPVTDDQSIHFRAHKTFDCFGRRADDGLVVVERRIEDNGHAGQTLEFFDELPVQRRMFSM